MKEKLPHSWKPRGLTELTIASFRCRVNYISASQYVTRFLLFFGTIYTSLLTAVAATRLTPAKSVRLSPKLPKM
ncbi:hypothetical protein RP20_CCG008335 [Aedes albopictus]|nr:hypothetical protein RP20_CCG008335 [Aedes albopictus]